MNNCHSDCILGSCECNNDTLYSVIWREFFE